MPKPTPKTPTPGNDRTAEEAHAAETYLQRIGEKTYGIFLNPAGVNTYFPESEVGPVSGNWQIRMKEGAPSDEANFVPGHGEYQSADAVLDTIAIAYRDNNDPSVAADLASTRLILMCRPGATDADVVNQKMRMNGVQSRFNKAIRLALEGN